ncbi:MAG: HU family DNA-binding protein [Bacteroidota bacterium]
MSSRTPMDPIEPWQCLTRRDIIEKVSEHTGYNKESVQKVILDFFQTITDELERGVKRIHIRPYFHIDVKIMPERIQYSLKTKAKYILPARPYVRMTPMLHFNTAVGNENMHFRNNRKQIEKRLALKEKRRLAMLANPPEKDLDTD